MLHFVHLAGYVVRLINNSPRVEGNNIMVDVDTDHPVQCGIRLATMASPLRNCETMHELFVTQELAIIISNIQYYYSSCSRYRLTFSVISGITTILLAIMGFEPLNFTFSIIHTGSSTSFSFRNVTPDDTKPYIMRVVVKPNTAESMRSTIKRRIWIPGMKLRIDYIHVCRYGKPCE